MLSCDCEYDVDDAPWFFYNPADFGILTTSRRKRCCSCKKLINIGALVLEFERARYAQNDIEYRIHSDDEIGMASWYHCESCGEIWLNLTAAGFCFDLEQDGDMHARLKEYHKLTGFKGGENND